MENAGAYAIGVHMRQIDERPRDKASWEKLAPIVSALSSQLDTAVWRSVHLSPVQLSRAKGPKKMVVMLSCTSS